MLEFRLAVVLLVAGFLNVEHVVEGVPQFKRCYNTSEKEMHCFDVQYETTTDQPLLTSIQSAIRRCQAINSTLVISKNEEIDSLIRQFTEESNHIIGYFWLNAYQINEFSNSYRWHWLNSTLPNLPGSAVSCTTDPGWYTAVLEFRTDNGVSQFYLTAKQPSSSFYYVCEYSVSNCLSTSSSDVRLMNGRCYVAVQESVTWYEARNRCVRTGGDLASFPNITRIDFISWLGSDPNVRFWIGLRFIWYTWGYQGQEVKYMNWNAYGPVWNASCAVSCYNCYPTFSWASRNCTDYMFVVCHTKFSNMGLVVPSVPQFKRCYNTSEKEMHCFDVQYDTATNQPLLTSIQNAIRRCQAINSTLVISKNEEIDSLLRQFTEDHNHLIGYFWLNAYQINEFRNSYRWHWLNSTLPNLPGSAVSSTNDPGCYTAVLEFRTDNGVSQFYLTAKQPNSPFCYVCEYSVSNCVSTSYNDVRLTNGRCYTAVQESVTWYEARNRCISNGGDLASFPNNTSIDFTSWLGSDPNVRFWIGLRFNWHTWGYQGQEVKYMNWNAYGPAWNAPCAVSCYNCYPTFSWASRNCTQYMFVVCHKITPLSATSTPVFKTSTSTVRTSTAVTKAPYG